MAKYHPARIRRVAEVGEDLAVAERLLWNELRVVQDDGLQFRRRVPIEGHTVDMLCQKANVVVHLEVKQQEARSYDLTLQRLLENQGFAVVRVFNEEILANAVSVAASVLEVCRQRLDPTTGLRLAHES